VKAENKSQILKLIIMYSLATFTGDFVKMILREPRPFYITDEILLDFCFTGFGGPSGHALRSLVFYVLMADNLLN
jgi:membrane-associated phospholipid phosphatase